MSIADGLTSLEAVSLAALGLFVVVMLGALGLAMSLRRRNLELTERLERHRRHLPGAALSDALTGLPNRQRLQDHIVSGLPVNDSEHATQWIVVLELVGLALIDEAQGRAMGDQVFRVAAERLSRSTQGSVSLLARLNRDAFGLLMRADSRADVALRVQSFFAALSDPYRVHNYTLRVSACAGIAPCLPPVNDPLEWLRQAELATKQARTEGSGAWHFHAPEMSVHVGERFRLFVELQQALNTNHLVLHYQPIIDATTGSIVAVEALLRWSHPQRGLLHPADFIPVADATGLIVPISNWEIEQACRDMRELRDRHHVTFPVVVSVSPKHFRRHDFVDLVRSALERYHLPAGALDLQLTEGIMFLDSAETSARLNAVRELGVGISLDDFGIGYSSLSYLKRLPIDKIKVDRSFVRDIVSDRRDASVTRSIIALAHDLTMKVVAEGVTTDAQYWFLKRNFCDEVQGGLFAEAAPLADFSQLLLEQAGRVSLPQASGSDSSHKVLLLVDDEANILRALSRLLRRDGYHILTATSPRHAFSLLAENDVHVVVSDQRMPEMTGTEFFSRVKEMYPETVRLILSGYTDLKSVTDAINRGSIYRFLTKPWDDDELRREVAEAFNAYEGHV